jgi:hypothetical protein
MFYFEVCSHMLPLFNSVQVGKAGKSILKDVELVNKCTKKSGQ